MNTQLIGVRFEERKQTKTCLSQPGIENKWKVGQGVIAEEEGVLCFGKIDWVSAPDLGYEEIIPQSVSKRFTKIRPATSTEEENAIKNEVLAKEAFLFCRSCIKARELNMKLVNAQILIDKTKFIFYFTAPVRIDFRDLVKDLVQQYHSRIELRQIGVRHETQRIGALGDCGMSVCCNRYLKDFAPVTIKMAKEQNLFLNPTKISGICGRLLCCLSYEQENYENFNKSCPKVGKRYQTQHGDVRILRCNMFRNTVIVLSEGGNEEEIPLEEWEYLNVKLISSSNEKTSSDQDSHTPLKTSNENNIKERELAKLLDDKGNELDFESESKQSLDKNLKHYPKKTPHHDATSPDTTGHNATGNEATGNESTGHNAMGYVDKNKFNK